MPCFFCSIDLENPLNHPDVDFGIDLDEFPNENNPNWESVPLSEFDDQIRQQWGLPKTLEKDDTTPFYNMSLGSYRPNQGRLNLTHAAQVEVIQNEEDYASIEEVYAAMKVLL